MVGVALWFECTFLWVDLGLVWLLWFGCFIAGVGIVCWRLLCVVVFVDCVFELIVLCGF